MMRRLEHAIASLQQSHQSSVDITGFKSYLRLSHQAFGWKVEKLNFFQQLYYYLFSSFGASLEEENKKLLQNNIAYLRVEAGINGKLGMNAQALIDLFHITFELESSKKQSEAAESSPIVAKATTPPSPIKTSIPSSPRKAPEIVPPVLDPSAENRLFFPNCQVKGINNPGNSCWINSCCQVLFRVESFVEALNEPPVRLEKETAEEFGLRKVVCASLKALYLEYINPRSTEASRSAAIEKMKIDLYHFAPGYFASSNPHAQHDSAEGMNALFKAVGMDPNPIALKGDLPIEQQISNSLTQGNMWVRLVIQLRELINPDEIKVREHNTDVFYAFREGRELITEDMKRAANTKLPEESEDQFRNRRFVIEAVLRLSEELKTQKALKLDGAENEEINVNRLRPLVRDLEAALKRFNPELNIHPSQVEAINNSLIDAFLPSEERMRILEKQMNHVKSVIKRDPSDKEIDDLSLSYDLRPSVDETNKLQVPPFICLTRQRLATQVVNGWFTSAVVSRGATEEEGRVPLEIDLAPLTIEGTSARYRLVGMAHHLGSSANSGHYVATVNSQGKAILANDSRTSEDQGFSCSHGVAVYQLIP